MVGIAFESNRHFSQLIISLHAIQLKLLANAYLIKVFKYRSFSCSVKEVVSYPVKACRNSLA